MSCRPPGTTLEPGCRQWEACKGDLKHEANAEAELQIRLHRTGGRLLRAIEEALGRIRLGTYEICGVRRARKERKQSNGAVEGRSSEPTSSYRWDLASRAMSIASLPGVKMADGCCGSRDVFAVAEVEESQELNKLVMDTIQRPEGVAGTSTHIALD